MADRVSPPEAEQSSSSQLPVDRRQSRILGQKVNGVAKLPVIPLTPRRESLSVVVDGERGANGDGLRSIAETRRSLSVPAVRRDEWRRVKLVASIQHRIEHEEGGFRLVWRRLNPAAPPVVAIGQHAALIVRCPKEDISRQVHD